MKPHQRDLRRGRVSIPGGVYFITAACVDRQAHFSSFASGSTAASCFDNSKFLGEAKMLAWVLMPDHAHWLLELGQKTDLSVTVNRLKSATARRVNQVLAREGSIWQKGFYDRAVRKEEDLRGVARYLVANPLRAGLVENIGDYPFWNAVWV